MCRSLSRTTLKDSIKVLSKLVLLLFNFVMLTKMCIIDSMSLTEAQNDVFLMLELNVKVCEKLLILCQKVFFDSVQCTLEYTLVV